MFSYHETEISVIQKGLKCCRKILNCHLRKQEITLDIYGNNTLAMKVGKNEEPQVSMTVINKVILSVSSCSKFNGNIRNNISETMPSVNLTSSNVCNLIKLPI
jgi:hypothetical protein